MMIEFARGILSNYFSVVGAQAISIPLSLLYLSLITRIMGPVNYGRFALFLASFQFFYTIFINWIRNSTIRFGSEEFTKQNTLNRIFSTQVLVLSAVLCFVISLAFIFKKNITTFTGLSTDIYLYLVVYLIFYTMFDFICILLQVTHQMQRYGLSLVVRKCIMLSLVILLLAFKMGLTPLGLVYIEIVSCFAVTLFAVSPLWKGRYFFPVVLSKQFFSDIVRYSWPVMILYVLGYFLLWADTLFIRLFLNFDSVGQYELANRLMQYVSSLIFPISIIAFPMVVSIKSKGREDLIVKYAQRVIPQVSFFWGIFMMFLMLFSGILFKVAFGSQYLNSVLIFRVLLIGASFQFLSVMYVSILQSYDLNRELLLVAAVAVVLNLSGDVLLIPRIGIMGAAFSKSVSLVAAGLFLMSRSLKCVNIKGGNYKDFLVFLTLPLLLFVLFLFVHTFPAMIVLTMILIVLSYFFVKHSSLFMQEDIDLIRQLKMHPYLKLAITKIYRGLLR